MIPKKWVLTHLIPNVQQHHALSSGVKLERLTLYYTLHEFLANDHNFNVVSVIGEEKNEEFLLEFKACEKQTG